MAKKLGVSYRTYQRVEANQSHISAGYFLRLLKSFDDTVFLAFLTLLGGKSEFKDYSSYKPKNIFQGSPAIQIKERKALTDERDFESVIGVCAGDIIVGYWEWDIGENTLFWSKEMYAAYGMDPNLGVDPQVVSSRKHP